MQKKNTTIHDIASAMKVSASTVSRALNNNPEISEKVRKEVHKTAKKLNYRQNVIASQLRKGQSKTIGLIVPRINRFFFADMIAGIETVSSKKGFNMIICQSDESIEKEKQNLATLMNNQVDGIIISISLETTSGSHLQEILNRQIPLVQADRIIKEVPSSSVINDNFKAAYEVVTHLLQKGYKKIAHFTGNPNINVYCERLEGYKKALMDHGIAYKPELVFENAITKERGEQIAFELYSRQNGNVDAICSAGDFSALGAMNEIVRMGMSVPDNVGISGFANEVLSQYCNPSITSVEQHGFEIGRAAANLLIEEIEEKNINYIPKQIVIAHELKIRNSSLKE